MKIGACDVEFIPVTHSVPEAMAIAFHTPQGVILHSGDFKLDLQPVDGRRTDMARMGELAQTEGIRLLLSDSTNAEEPGFTESESSVGVTLRRVFAAQAGKRIVVACFASHMHRVQQIIDAAVANGRKVATLGRSMGKNVELGIAARHHQHPRRASQIDIEDVDSVPRGRDVRDLDRLAGRADVGPLAHGDRARTSGCASARTTWWSSAPTRSRATSGRWARSSTTCTAGAPRWCTRGPRRCTSAGTPARGSCAR